MAGHHVAGKSDGVADRPHEVGDQLDQREDRAQRQRRRLDPEEFEEMRAVLDEAEDRHCQEHRHGEDAGHRDMARGGQRAGNEAEEVREDDEAEQREDVGEELQPLLAGHILDHLVHEAVAEFRDRLDARGDDRAAACAEDEKPDDAEDRDPHPQRRVGRRVPVDRAVAEQRLDPELIHRVKDQTFFFRQLARHGYSLSSPADASA